MRETEMNFKRPSSPVKTASERKISHGSHGAKGCEGKAVLSSGQTPDVSS